MWMTDCPTSFTDSCLSDIKASRLIDLEYTSILIDLYCYRSGYNGNVDWRRPVRHDFFFWNLLRFPDTRFRRERWPISSINWSGVGRTLPFRVQWDVSCLDILRGIEADWYPRMTRTIFLGKHLDIWDNYRYHLFWV